jgi:hypothetical protein
VDRGPVEAFVRPYVVRGPVVNALGRLRDAGIPVVEDMQDMKYLVPVVAVDLEKDGEAWKALLESGLKDGDLRSTVSRVLSSVYRQMLTEGVS